MKRGDWVSNKQEIGIVSYVYEEDDLIDVVIYDRKGNRLGRTSPPEGGPTKFEPCCSTKYWKVIETPQFPLTQYDHLENLVTFKEAPHD